ncbi:MAG: Crp/Fnr family transcriptional regulator [Coriobacteriia bacterium]|nr:Crp/Fnr family transcriptional regulator [Coriobacteriia bacterium]
MGKLRRFSLFANVSSADAERLTAMLRVRRYPKGAFVVTRGERAAGLYLLSSGRAKITIASPDGKELVLGHIDGPAHFGEVSLVEGQPHPADVVAVTSVEVLMIDARSLAEVIRLQPRIAVSLIGALSERLSETIGRLEDLTFHDAAHRVMRVLLNIGTARYELTGEALIARYTHYDIATLAGTSRETASRVISSLARDEVLEVRGRSILVDLDALARAMRPA